MNFENYIVCHICDEKKPRQHGHQKYNWVCPTCSEELCEDCTDTDHRETQSNSGISELIKGMISRAKIRAADKGREFTITPDDILAVWPRDGLCPVLKQPLKKAKGKSGVRTWSPQLDRIDNDKGYTPDNIQILSKRANVMKSDASEEELLTFAKYVTNTYGDNI